jgi:hypothetical protein
MSYRNQGFRDFIVAAVPAKTKPHSIYASIKTGLLSTDDKTVEQKQEWDKALARYDTLASAAKKAKTANQPALPNPRLDHNW